MWPPEAVVETVGSVLSFVIISISKVRVLIGEDGCDGKGKV